MRRIKALKNSHFSSILRCTYIAAAAMDCDKGFSSSYMLLKPEELTFFDLVNILFSTDIEKRKFVDSAEVKEEDFQRRWLIFISIIVQKLLQFFSKPISFFGSLTEMWLNLLSSNGGFGSLLLNTMEGYNLKQYI